MTCMVIGMRGVLSDDLFFGLEDVAFNVLREYFPGVSEERLRDIAHDIAESFDVSLDRGGVDGY